MSASPGEAVVGCCQVEILSSERPAQSSRPVLCSFVFLDTTRCGNRRNLSQRLAAQGLGLDGEPAPVVVREPETLVPKSGSGAQVLLSQVVDHILLLAVDPCQLERAVGIARGTS